MTTPSLYNVQKIREDFPILQKNIHGYPLAYLDNAATTQKPLLVLNSVAKFYEESNANVHRGTHQLAETATLLYENAREKAKTLINAASVNECVFVRGTTEGINLVANGFIHSILKPGDEIIISHIEHHSNIVPWQIACEYTGATLRIIPCNAKGELLLDEYAKLLNDKTKLVAVTHVSNLLGTINPIAEMVAMAHQHHCPILIDGAQAIAHLKVDVQALDCDFYAFSAHKMYGPTGIGVLYGKREWLNRLPPFQGGGEMIKSVTFEKTIFNDLPLKFEAGTPAFAQAIGLGAAIDYLNAIGLSNIASHEHSLLEYAMSKLEAVPTIRFIGTAKDKSAIISFILENIHAHDVGTVLNQKGIAVRTGKLCAEPTLERFGIQSTVRASFGLYNTEEEIDRLVNALIETYHLFNR
ncbi:MAG: SufS family cysteine desulfurase [Candidatus Berkiellales bacterium]